MDEIGGWAHYHKWRRLKKENEELKKIIKKLAGEKYLVDLEKDLQEKEMERKT